MRALSSVVARPGLAVGVCCGAVGLGLQGPEAAVLWSLVGYFVGKSLQSTLWSVTGGPTT